jgi:hypothetical protein
VWRRPPHTENKENSECGKPEKLQIKKINVAFDVIKLLLKNKNVIRRSQKAPNKNSPTNNDQAVFFILNKIKLIPIKMQQLCL